MADHQIFDQVTFPRKGTDYTPLPRGNQDGRILSHAVQTISATPDQIFQVYARAELLPAWQEGVISVTSSGENTFHWVMQDPGTGRRIEFDSEIVEAIPGVRHTSRVTSGPAAGTTDTLSLEATHNDRGTIVTWVSDFNLPGGALANAVAAVVSRSPQQIVIENLRHLKEMMESREIPSVEGQPAGPRGVMGKWKRLLMGENLQTPPGSSDRARPRDLPEAQGTNMNAPVLAGVAVLAGLATWYGIRRSR